MSNQHQNLNRALKEAYADSLKDLIPNGVKLHRMIKYEQVASRTFHRDSPVESIWKYCNVLEKMGAIDHCRCDYTQNLRIITIYKNKETQ